MAEKAVQRWEDVIPWWRGPSYRDQALRYHPSAGHTQAAGAVISSVADWDGDLVISSWDACYEGVIRLFRRVGRTADGSPLLSDSRILEGVMGHAAVVADNGDFGLLTTSRLRPALHLFRNRGTRHEPHFEAPEEIALEADWLHPGEILHKALFADIDGDGRQELVVGTDFWSDYWPDGVEWFEEAYRPYDGQGRWRGGPLRGHLYVFENTGTPLKPVLGRGKALHAAGKPVEVYGMAAPTFADFRGSGRLDLVCGDFLDRLHFFPNLGGGAFGLPSPVRRADGSKLVLDHCIHFPAAADWTGSGKPDLLVGAEDGCVWLLRHAGLLADGAPAFHDPVQVPAIEERIHAGVLPVPAAADWTGRGRADLIVGDSAGELLFFAAEEGDVPTYARAARIEAGGRPVSIRAGQPGSLQGPAEVRFGYTCPTAADWDGDGLPDLLVSSVLGEHLFFRCTALGNPPRFEPGRHLTWGGEPLRTVWRVRPAVVDWESEGALSYVSLDDEGLLASWRRKSDTELDDKRILRFENGDPVRFTEDFGGGRGRIKLCFADWTGDGRPDLIIGTHSRASVPPGLQGAPRHTTGQAAVLLLRNVGTPAEPRFALPRPICHAGEPIRLGMHACSPEIFDWRGSGMPDLLVGAEDGSLIWFRREELSW